MERLYAPSNSAEHPQHPIQLLLFVSSLGIDRKPKSAKDRFIDSSNRGLHSRKSIHRIAERDEARCCRPGLVGVCGTRWGERFLLAAQPQPSNAATRSYIPALKPDRGLFGSRKRGRNLERIRVGQVSTPATCRRHAGNCDAPLQLEASSGMPAQGSKLIVPESLTSRA
jgi:hypothetical protein